ncbi:MAG: ABC transporter ATP-binding protein [Pseudobdellovibrio sp.]
MNLTTDENHIAFKNVSKKHASSGFELKPLDLTIERYDFVTLLGPSGSGKSTLLRLIADLEKADGGEITLTSQEKFGLSYVFQDAQLLPWRSLQKNVELPLEFMGISTEERRKRALESLKQVGLESASELYPSELSGGMKMRGSLARALVTKPQLLLLDEPFAALDEQIRFKLAEDLRKLWLSQKMTVVFVTHSLQEACSLSNRVLILANRPTYVKADLKIALPQERPTSLRTEAQFNEQLKLIYNAFNSEKKND